MLDNLSLTFPRIINVVSKISAAKSDESVVKASGDGSSHSNPKSKDPREIVPPSLSTTALSTPTSAQGSSGGGNDISLRRQALECLVSVLRSLVTWGTTTERSGPEGGDKSHAPKQVDSIGPQRNGVTNGSSERLSISNELSRVSTPDVIDDPSRFESAKQKKTLLTDGIKKFNFKPKKVAL
jgi:brefeldin A-inhibited guanine nucleotide-exchange protein